MSSDDDDDDGGGEGLESESVMLYDGPRIKLAQRSSSSGSSLPSDPPGTLQGKWSPDEDRRRVPPTAS